MCGGVLVLLLFICEVDVYFECVVVICVYGFIEVLVMMVGVIGNVEYVVDMDG